MSVTSKSGSVGFGTKSGAMFFDMGRYNAADTVSTTVPPTETSPDNTTMTGIDFVPWGNDNRLPLTMIEDIEACGVLNGAIDGKARFGLGKGVMPATLESTNPDGSEVIKPLVDSEISDWMEENVLFDSCFGWLKDNIGLGQDVARFKFNANGTKIGICARHDVSEFRFAPKNKKLVLDRIHLSANWGSGSMKASDVITLPLMPKIAAAQWLSEIQPMQRRNKEYAMVCRQPGFNRHFYSMPLWYSAKLWVEIAKGVPEMKAAMFENNIRIKYMVIIHQEYWTNTFPDWDSLDKNVKDTKRRELWDDIDSFLAGSENAYKSIFVDGHTNIALQQRYANIEIKAIDDNTKQGELLPDSAAANSEILFTLMMNPALMGANSPGGGYGGGSGSGSDIREAALVQVMIQEFERMSITRKLNVVAKINGWKARYPKLVWRFPGLVLTTLDKGGSTEQVMTGGKS